MATPSKRKNNSNKILITIAILVALGIAGGLFAKYKGWIGKADVVKVAVEKAEERKIIETVSASGKIYPVIEVAVSPDVSGEIMELTVEEGDSVKRGQLIARINPEIYESVVDQANAGVNASRSNESTASARIKQGEAGIKQLQVQIENTRRSLKRSQQLFKDGVISKAELETAETATQQLEAQLQGAQADLSALREGVQGASYNTQSTQASLKQARDNLRRTNVYAPLSGIVSKLNVKKGERVVGTSQFTGTEMLRIADFKAMEARVDVSENDIVRVSMNDTALVDIDAYPNRKFKGIVTQIASSAGSSSQLQVATNQITNFIVKIRLLPSSYLDLMKQNTLPFRPGMSCSADIQTETVDKALSVPIQAVTTREDTLKKQMNPNLEKSNKDDDIKELVFVLSNGMVIGREVTVGVQDESYIQVLSGLKGGEEVIAAPYRVISKELKDSLKVEKVSKEELYKKEQ